MKYLILWGGELQILLPIFFFFFLFHYIILYAGKGWNETGLMQVDGKLKNKFGERCINGRGRVGG